jgi:hypothetical protein
MECPTPDAYHDRLEKNIIAPSQVVPKYVGASAEDARINKLFDGLEVGDMDL